MMTLKKILTTTILSALIIPMYSIAQPTILKDSHDGRSSYAPYNEDKYPKNGLNSKYGCLLFYFFL